MPTISFIAIIILIYTSYVTIEVASVPRITLRTNLTYSKGVNPLRVDQKTERSNTFGNVDFGNIWSNNIAHFQAGVSIDLYILKVSSLLKDNLIKAFGYILHRESMELNSELYTSLFFILTTIKLNLVDTISMVPILSDLSFKTSNDRFFDIFQSLEVHLPEYIKEAATYWKLAIQQKVVNLDVIFMPYENSNLKVDILSGMNKEILDKIKQRQVAEPPKNQEEARIVFNYNVNILHIMRHLKENPNNLNNVFVAALLEHLPRQSIQPYFEEAIKLVGQYLEEDKTIDWNVIKGRIQPTEDPTVLVNSLLEILYSDSNIPVNVKSSLQAISRNLNYRTPVAINPNYQSLAHIVDIDRYNISVLLDYVVNPGTYPHEIVSAAKKLKTYVDQGLIRYLSLIQNFNPYSYSSLTEVYMSLLFRLFTREPDLAVEVLDVAGAVYSYVVFAYRYVNMFVVLPPDININVIVLGLKAPDIRQDIKNQLTTTISALQQTNLDYNKILLTKIPPFKCATPVLCFLELLTELYRMKSLAPNATIALNVIFNSTCISGRCPAIEIENNVIPTPPPIVTDVTTGSGVTSVATTFPTTESVLTPTITTETPPSLPTEGNVSSPHTFTPTPATTPTPFQTTSPDPLTNVTADVSQIITMIHELARKMSLDENMVNQMLQVLEVKEVKEKLIQNALNATILIAGFLTALEQIKDMNETQEITSEFRTFVDDLLENLESEKSILEVTPVEGIPQEPLLIKLIVAVEAPKTEEEKVNFQILQTILSKQERFQFMYEFMKNNDFRNAGNLLTAVIQAQLQQHARFALTQKEREVLEFYVPKIQTFGMAQGKIVYGVVAQQLFQEVDISETMDIAIDFNSLAPEDKVKFNTIIQYILDNPAMLKTWHKWVFYRKSGEFTEALFRLLATQPNLTATEKDALTSIFKLIKKTGKGLDPVVVKK